MSQGTEYVRWFGELGIDDVADVGGRTPRWVSSIASSQGGVSTFPMASR